MDPRDYPQTPTAFIPAPRPQQVWDVIPAAPGQEVTVASHAAYSPNVHDLVRYDGAAAHGQVVPVDQRQPMVWVPAGANNFVAVPKDSLPAGYLHTTVIPTPQPLPAAGPLIDPRAQILAAGGVTAAGIGWGTAQILSSLAGLSGGALLALAVLLIALRTPASRTGGGDTYNITNRTTNNNRWFGKSTSNNG